MGGRHGPHAITGAEELLEIVIDELKGLRADLALHFAPASPEPAGRVAAEKPADPGPVAIPIREPATSKPDTIPIREPAKPAAPPAKKAAAKATTSGKGAKS